jgi:ssDNA-binding Zn-finger/Zn-ribbon topoisomerase 1
MVPKLKDVPKKCPRCGKSLRKRQGEYGTYLDCTGYPECKYTLDISGDIKVKSSSKNYFSLPAKCPRCNKKLAIYVGEKGAFLGCNGYPGCRFSIKVKDIANINCPKCGKLMTERTGKNGLFFGCRGYPSCKFTFDLRVYKTSKKDAKAKEKYRKRLEFEQLESPMNNDKILRILSEGWYTIAQIASKLDISKKSDLKFLSLKIKQLERKKTIDAKFQDGYEYWKRAI